MATPAAAVGFQIVILLSGGSFQAVLPGVSGQPSPVFPDTPAGSTAFMEWVKPQWPKGRWNPPPTQVCVVGMTPFAADRPPQLPQALYASKPPFRVMEPYAATFHYIGEAEQRQGLRSRTPAQALALCGMKAK
jgi:hypothetical protein